MAQTINLQYQLTNRDRIEAEQLKLIKSPTAWFNLFTSFLLIIYGCIDLKRVSEPDFLVFEYLKELFVSEEITTNHLFLAIFYFSFALLISFSTFPKYNPLYRWTLWRKYQKNFFKQETKNVIINETQINIESKNHRIVIQWQDFTQFRENNRIFLLDGSKNQFVIIPKQVFATTAEIDNVRNILNSKIS